MPNIFISYRRDDAPANARLVYERLREWFGEGNSFMDVEQIALGDDWKHVLDQRVTRCDALLAVIGPTGGSLPLEAAFAPSVIDRPPPQAEVLQIHFPSGTSQWVRFSFLQRIQRADADCPARAPGTEVARVIMRLSHRERLREPSRRFDMNAVLDGTVDRHVFSGKRVLVGAEHPLDALETRMDINEQRYGFEFHADVMNALLNDDPVQERRSGAGRDPGTG